MKIVIGLGNPGTQYAATRHNIGWDTITRLSDDFRIPLDFKKHKAICGKGTMVGERVILAQPQTFMNLSGASVQELILYYKVTPDDIIVIYDDISLEPGQIRVRPQGSAGGHNGIKNIISVLGTDIFPRIRIGIGEKPRGWDLADYVLCRFTKEEDEAVREAMGRAVKACEKIMVDGVEAAMNEFNRKHAGTPA